MVLVVVEFHTLNDMIPEPDTDIAVRLQIARQRRRAAAHGNGQTRKCAQWYQTPKESLPAAWGAAHEGRGQRSLSRREVLSAVCRVGTAFLRSV